MKRLVAFVLTMVCVIGLVGCGAQKLTLDDVVALSAKGEALTWSDFEEYDCTETGSGLYILYYEINKDFELIIGGGSKEEPPLYIYLSAKDTDDAFVDIRTNDVNAFIEANQG